MTPANLPCAQEVAARRDIMSANVEAVLEEELAQVFSDVLEDAGVFKRTDEGDAGWQRFIKQL